MNTEMISTAQGTARQIKRMGAHMPFGMEFREAIQNALDIGATEFKMLMSIGGWKKGHALLAMFDNGSGFTLADISRFGTKFSEPKFGSTTNFGIGIRIAFAAFADLLVFSKTANGEIRQFAFEERADGTFGLNEFRDALGNNPYSLQPYKGYDFKADIRGTLDKVKSGSLIIAVPKIKEHPHTFLGSPATNPTHKAMDGITHTAIQRWVGGRFSVFLNKNKIGMSVGYDIVSPLAEWASISPTTRTSNHGWFNRDIKAYNDQTDIAPYLKDSGITGVIPNSGGVRAQWQLMDEAKWNPNNPTAMFPTKSVGSQLGIESIERSTDGRRLGHCGITANAAPYITLTFIIPETTATLSADRAEIRLKGNKNLEDASAEWRIWFSTHLPESIKTFVQSKMETRTSTAKDVAAQEALARFAGSIWGSSKGLGIGVSSLSGSSSDLPGGRLTNDHGPNNGYEHGPKTGDNPGTIEPTNTGTGRNVVTGDPGSLPMVTGQTTPGKAKAGKAKFVTVSAQMGAANADKADEFVLETVLDEATGTLRLDMNPAFKGMDNMRDFLVSNTSSNVSAGDATTLVNNLLTDVFERRVSEAATHSIGMLGYEGFSGIFSGGDEAAVVASMVGTALFSSIAISDVMNKTAIDNARKASKIAGKVTIEF